MLEVTGVNEGRFTFPVSDFRRLLETKDGYTLFLSMGEQIEKTYLSTEEGRRLNGELLRKGRGSVREL